MELKYVLPYRRILKISWMDSITKVQVMQMIQKELREVAFNVPKKRKLEYFEHIMRGLKYKISQQILQGKQGVGNLKAEEESFG